MHISTIICIGIAVLIILASSDDIAAYHAQQRVARHVLNAWRNANRKKVQK